MTTTHDSNHPAGQPSILARARRGVPSLIRSLAGTPAGWQASRRRGSFLIIVVGTLALLAVLAIIYSSIGSHDVRMTASVKKQERLETIPDQVKDYLVTIIGESTVGTFYDSRRYVTGRDPIPLSRVTFDYPSTSYDARSNRDVPTTREMPFTPTGSVSGFMGAHNFTDQNRYLAGNLPDVWRPSTPWLADTEPTYLGPALDAATAARVHQLRRDWRKISNISPDGRFVNLVNLRAGSAPGRGWDATHEQMSQETDRLYSGTEPGPGSPLQGPTLRTTDFGVTLDRHIPAHLDSRQIWLFRPARAAAGLLPSDPAYDHNLFADADGDGMFDSRWQELKEWRTGWTSDKDYLDVDDRYRVFVAVRIIDASALINLNTATDQRGAPTALAPIGLTPADVDGRKLLTGWDARISSNLGTVNSQTDVTGVGYESINHDFPAPAAATPANQPYNYAAANLDDGRKASFTSGIYAYDALRLALATGITPPIGLTGPNLGTTYETAYGLAHDRWNFENQPTSRAEHYNWMSVSMQGASRDMSAPPATPTVRLTGALTLDDLYELNMRRVVNDAGVTSALELTLGGRAQPSSAAPPNETRYSPLRSNRPLEIERRRFAQFDPTPGSDYDKTMLLFENDIRQRVTTVSGSRQLRWAPAYIDTTGARTIDPYELKQNELRSDPRLTMAVLTDRATAPAQKALATNEIFRFYTDALLPRLAFGSPWPNGSSTQDDERATEFYGHRGPEMALRIAAHMTANFIDGFDKELPPSGGGTVPPEQPTVHTLVMHRDAAPTPTTGINAIDISTPEGIAISNWLKGPVFPVTDRNGNTIDVHPLEFPAPDVAAERLARGADTLHTPGAAPVITVYGVEAQPFITQVASFTVYGDDANNSDGEGPEHNINGDTDRATNHDLMYRMVAFQIHNPFSVDIKLSNQAEAGVNNTGAVSASTSDDSFYYITFGTKTFKLGSLLEDTDTQGVYASEDVRIEPITIPAGSTIVVYALTDTPQHILTRMKGLGDAGSGAGYLHQPDGTGVERSRVQRYIKRALEANLGAFSTSTPRVAGVYWVPEIDAAGMLKTPTAENDLVPAEPTPGNPDVFAHLWRTIRVNDTRVDPPGVGVMNLTGNDQLVDRLRIPTGVAGAEFKKFARVLDPGQNTISGSDASTNSVLYTVTTWGVVSRPGDPAAASPPRGALPAYCLEPKFAPAWNSVEAGDFGQGTSLDDREFVVGVTPRFEGAAKNLNSWFSNMGASELGNMAKHPDDLTAPTTWQTADSQPRPYGENYIEVPVIDNNLRTRGTVAGNNVTVTTVRPADLLLPLGVGPEEMPLDVSYRLVDDLERRWTTLGEALSMSLLYQTNRSPTQDDVGDIYFPVAGSTIDPQFSDRGHLRLDAYCPYIDVAPVNQQFDAGRDQRIGTQAPLALSILDAFTTSPADFEANYRWDSLKRATMGVINVNTVALNTLRAAFPTLSPPPNTDPAGQAWWWWATGDLNQQSDIAATVVAYRDKIDSYVHTMARVPNPNDRPPPNDQGQDRLVTFNWNPGGGGTNPDTPDLDNGRSTWGWNQVTPIHEQPGFRSRGELLSARFIYDPSNIAQSASWPGNMDFLGHDLSPTTGQPTPSGLEGLDTLLYRDNSGNLVVSEVPNSYKEQLTVINTVLNSVSTRSDYFICWFLVHGYQKSDVENLGDNDPMVPSMARRFVMVVDRSKVTRLGEKPNVILFKEVPVDPVPR